ncbi:MAG: hypothetical protein JKX76_06465 [Colwellia sp.]|nr:hypothetical protein [Colwellia sp.]
MNINQENLEYAGFFLEKELGVFDEFNEYRDFRLHNSSINNFSKSELVESVSVYILNNLKSSGELLPLAVSTLGKSKDKQYKKLYITVMRESQDTNIAACLQAALAYESLGFTVFLSRDEVVDENSLLRLIKDYLLKNHP